MDYVQVFCGGVTLAFFIWVAKTWWNTDREQQLFQRKAWLVMTAVTTLGIAYTFGALMGANVMLDEWYKSIRQIAAATHVEVPSPQALPDDTRPHFQNPVLKVLIPGWAVFYWMVLWFEILIATTMPDRKRTNGQANLEPQNRQGERSNTEPDTTG